MSAPCVHRFDFVPFEGIVCVNCRVPATTETTPVPHPEHHWVKQGAGTICDGCGLIRGPGASESEDAKHE